MVVHRRSSSSSAIKAALWRTFEEYAKTSSSSLSSRRLHREDFFHALESLYYVESLELSDGMSPASVWDHLVSISRSASPSAVVASQEQATSSCVSWSQFSEVGQFCVWRTEINLVDENDTASATPTVVLDLGPEQQDREVHSVPPQPHTAPPRPRPQLTSTGVPLPPDAVPVVNKNGDFSEDFSAAHPFAASANENVLTMLVRTPTAIDTTTECEIGMTPSPRRHHQQQEPSLPPPTYAQRMDYAASVVEMAHEGNKKERGVVADDDDVEEEEDEEERASWEDVLRRQTALLRVQNDQLQTLVSQETELRSHLRDNLSVRVEATPTPSQSMSRPNPTVQKDTLVSNQERWLVQQRQIEAQQADLDHLRRSLVDLRKAVERAEKRSSSKAKDVKKNDNDDDDGVWLFEAPKRLKRGAGKRSENPTSPVNVVSSKDAEVGTDDGIAEQSRPPIAPKATATTTPTPSTDLKPWKRTSAVPNDLPARKSSTQGHGNVTGGPIGGPSPAGSRRNSDAGSVASSHGVGPARVARREEPPGASRQPSACPSLRSASSIRQNITTASALSFSAPISRCPSPQRDHRRAPIVPYGTAMVMAVEDITPSTSPKQQPRQDVAAAPLLLDTLQLLPNGNETSGFVVPPSVVSVEQQRHHRTPPRRSGADDDGDDFDIIVQTAQKSDVMGVKDYGQHQRARGGVTPTRPLPTTPPMNRRDLSFVRGREKQNGRGGGDEDDEEFEGCVSTRLATTTGASNRGHSNNNNNISSRSALVSSNFAPHHTQPVFHACLPPRPLHMTPVHALAEPLRRHLHQAHDEGEEEWAAADYQSTSHDENGYGPADVSHHGDDYDNDGLSYQQQPQQRRRPAIDDIPDDDFYDEGEDYNNNRRAPPPARFDPFYVAEQQEKKRRNKHNNNNNNNNNIHRDPNYYQHLTVTPPPASGRYHYHLQPLTPGT
eukprot:PhM_4_TR1335/c3_g1_i1/m.48682